MCEGKVLMDNWVIYSNCLFVAICDKLLNVPVFFVSTSSMPSQVRNPKVYSSVSDLVQLLLKDF